MLRLAHPVLTHEDVFLERYERLLTAAATLTAGDRAAALDLVHDAFLHFVLARPRLDTITDLDGYLFVAIRNLHISQIRRASRTRHQSLSLVDFDSAVLGLKTLPAAHRFEALDELRWICEYALERRAVLRAASAFLLHYFLRYRPSEIAAVLQSPSVTVRKLLHVARADVHRALEHRAAGGLERHRRIESLEELRGTILRAPASPCPPRSTLMARYAAAASIDVTTLAHVVSCRTCLDRVNTLLGLPRLIDRERDGDDRPSDRPGSGPASTTRSKRTQVAVPSAADVAAVREHCPKELRILVNGLSLGRQRVAGPENEQVIRLSAHEPVTVVEVFSEQDVRLLLLNAEPIAEGLARQSATVCFSEERELRVVLDLSDLYPSVEVFYRDPSFALISGTDASGPDDESGDVEGAEPIAIYRRREALRTEGLVPRLAMAWHDFSRALRGHRRRQRALQAAGAIVVLWLLFFTPGSSASAAELAYRELLRAISVTWRWLNPPISLPPVGPPLGDARTPLPPMTPPLEEPARTVIPAPRMVGALDRARAELLALARLQRVDAYLGQEVQFGVGAGGRARIEAVVGDARRRAELIAAVAPFAGVQPLDVEVLTLEQLAARTARAGRATSAPQREGTSSSVRLFEFDGTRPTAATAVLEHVGSEQAAREFVNQLLERSRQASQHAWALQHLSERYSPALAEKLPGSEQEVLTALIVHHAREFDGLVQAIADSLRPIFKAGPEGKEPAVATDPPDFWHLTRGMLDLNHARDEAIRGAFVVSTAGSPTMSLDGTAFWNAVSDSRRLARQLRRHLQFSRN
jgi:RNA polymerase sigma factor (sigma-70 family)